MNSFDGPDVYPLQIFLRKHIGNSKFKQKKTMSSTIKLLHIQSQHKVVNKYLFID